MAATHMACASGISMRYRLEGAADAPVVMLAHGVLTSHAMWDAVTHALLPCWRILRYDLRGHGETAATQPPYRMDRLARDAVDLMDALAIRRVHFIGSSLGGMIGQHLAARFGDRLESVTLANTAAVQSDPHAWQERIDTALTCGVHPLVEGTLQRWFTPEFRRTRASIVDAFRRIALRTTTAGFAGCAAAVRDLDHADILMDIDLPTLVLAGARDEAIPAAASVLLAQAIARSQSVVLPAAHQAAAECPREFVHAWTAFVGRTAPGTP